MNALYVAKLQFLSPEIPELRRITARPKCIVRSSSCIGVCKHVCWDLTEMYKYIRVCTYEMPLSREESDCYTCISKSRISIIKSYARAKDVAHVKSKH